MFLYRVQTLLPGQYTHVLQQLNVCTGPVSSPQFFLHVRFFYKLVFLQRALSPPVPPPTGSFFTLERESKPWFFTNVLYKVQTPIRTLLYLKLSGNFLHLSFYTIRFSPSPWLTLLHVVFLQMFLYKSADTPSGSLYALSTCEIFLGGGGR